MTSTLAQPQAAPRISGRLFAALRGETRLVRLALGVVALHVVDDNFLQPAPGTSAGDHLASGLVPLALLGLAAVVYPRLRSGRRAALAATLGGIGIAIGIPSAYLLAEGAFPGDGVTGLLALAAGLVLLSSAPVVLWRSRRPGRWRRARTVVGGLLLGVVLLSTVVFPVAVAYVYTHAGRVAVTPDLGVPLERAAVTTEDGLRLAAWYAPSGNGAAVVVFPGATRTEEARMLLRHGYGVLLLEPRGQGGSEGDVVRWAGDRDLLAGAAYLAGRPDVHAGRIGAIGFSIGGENLLEAAARSDAFAAVVSEGAGSRVGDADASGADRILAAPMLAVMTAATAVFSNQGPPPPIVERIGSIAPRPVLLVYAEPGVGDESTRQPEYFAAAGEPKELWKVPGSAHTGGIEAQPEEYERRVVGFLDHALLGPP